jgi:hypothetical protein
MKLLHMIHSVDPAGCGLNGALVSRGEIDPTIPRS